MTYEIEPFDPRPPARPGPAGPRSDPLEDAQQDVRGAVVRVVKEKLVVQDQLDRARARLQENETALTRLAAQVRRSKQPPSPEVRRALDEHAAHKLLAEQQVRHYETAVARLAEYETTLHRRRLSLDLEADQVRQSVETLRRNANLLTAGHTVTQAEAELRRLSDGAQYIRRAQEDELAGVLAELQVPQVRSAGLVDAAEREVDELLNPPD